ncbi:MAG TPA: hypothetical protein VGU66_02825 [Candidatus Elarobacter sp.]|nr:hypothetical protein [Candidatus Elarobacter sp.]
MRISAALIVVVAAGALPAAGTAQTPPPGVTEIYVKMRAAVNALPVPAYIAFTVQESSTRKSGLIADRLRIVERVSDAHAWVRTIRNMHGDAVHVEPQVVTGNLFPNTLIERVGEFPLADFGLRPRRAGRTGIFEAPGTPEPTPSAGPLRAIGSVTGYNLSYRIADLGDTELGGAPVHHLGLFPYRDPGHNVLREVWIDASTFIPKRYVAERFVENGGLSFRYLITVDTAVIDGHLVNVGAAGHFELHRALIINVTGDGRWAISDVTFPADPPAWLFDPDRYKDHKGEPVPDL